MENLGEYFFDQINQHLAAVKCSLTRLEMGESPTRFFLPKAEDEGAKYPRRHRLRRRPPLAGDGIVTLIWTRCEEGKA